MTKSFSALIVLLLLISVKGATQSIPKQENQNIIQLLENPLDIVEYKRLKRSANNGGGRKQPYFYRPDYPGFFYSYFIFGGKSEHTPYLTVYKKGSKIGYYSDTNEEFIQVWSAVEDKDLGEADLARKKIADIKSKFGPQYVETDTHLIYQHKRCILVIRKAGSICRWFKIARLNKSFKNLEDLPEEIFEDHWGNK